MAYVDKPTRVDPKTGKTIKYKHWYVFYTDEHGRRRKQKASTDKAAAQALAREIERRVERTKAGIAPVQAQDYGQAVDAYLAEMRRLGRDEDYVREQRRQLLLLRQESGWRDVGDVKAQDLRAHIDRLAAKGRAPRTLNTVRDALSIFCNFCVERGWLADNPVKGVKKAKAAGGVKARVRRAYTRDEFARLLAAAPAGRRLVYLVAALSGLRRSEMVLLEKRDLTPTGDRPAWHLRPEIAKGRRRDVVPMLPECAEALAGHWQSLPAPAARVFARVPRHRTMAGDLGRAGIPRKDELGRQLDFHSLRYYFCTLLGGVLPIQTVRLLMRHRDIRTTCNLYLDLGLSDVAEETLRLPRLLRPARGEGREKKQGRRGAGRGFRRARHAAFS